MFRKHMNKLTSKETPSFVSVDNPNIIIETVKKAEDDNSVIIRMYECSGGTRNAKLIFGKKVSNAFLVNIMEEKPGSIDLDDIKFKPFEIYTIKVEF